MLRHVVLFKFRPDVAADDRQRLWDALHALADALPMVQQLTVGQNITDSPRACDLVLLVDVADEDALRAYDTHPDHAPVKALAGRLCSATHIVDYPLA